MARPTLLETKEKMELAPRGRGRPPTTTKSAVLALQHAALSKLTPVVFERLREALENPEDPLHAKAFELTLDRVAPKAYWQQLAEKELGGGGQRPQINITINGDATVQQAEAPIDVDYTENEE